MRTADLSILERLLDPVSRCLTAEVARGIVNLRADPMAQARRDELADKGAKDQLTPAELAEYEAYVRADELVTILQAKALAVLAASGGSSSTRGYVLCEREQQRVEDFYWAREAPEVRQHQGQFVVVRDKRVVAIGTDRPALVKRAAQEEGCAENDLVVLVVPRASLTAESPR